MSIEFKTEDKDSELCHLYGSERERRFFLRDGEPCIQLYYDNSIEMTSNRDMNCADNQWHKMTLECVKGIGKKMIVDGQVLCKIEDDSGAKFKNNIDELFIGYRYTYLNNSSEHYTG